MKKKKEKLVDLNKCIYSREMTYYYNYLNRRFWAGKLPNIEVYFGPISAPRGKFKYGVTGVDAENEVYYIVLNRKLDMFGDDIAQLILTHESIHARYPHIREHGAKFKKIARRLIRAGALDDIL